MMNLTKANKNVETYSLYNKNLSPISQKIEKNISNLVNSNVKEADELNSQNDVDFLKVRIIIISISVFALALVLMVSIFITKIIANPIKNIAAYVDKIV